MRYVISAIFCLLFFIAKAQQNCNCTQNLQQYIRHVSENYSGFHDKVNPTTKSAYQRLTDSLLRQTTNATDPKACYRLLDKYRSFFYDQHLILTTDLAIDKPLPYGLKAGVIKQTKWSPQSVRSYLQQNKNRLQPLEGIWRSGEFEVAVVYEPAQQVFQGIVLKADDKERKPGTLLFVSKPVWPNEYQTYFQDASKTWEDTHSEIERDVLVHEFYGIWRKQFPIVSDTLPEDDILSRFGDVQMRLLDTCTLYIRLNSCSLDNKTLLESYLKQYEPRLSSVPNWIIDLRTNRGGSTVVFAPLEPYLYTRQYIGKGDRFWATPAHTAFLKQFLTQYDSVLNQAAKTALGRRVQFGQENPGKWLIESGDTVHYDKKYDYPKRVAILSSKHNASAGESFLITAKGMSEKVTIFGDYSAGLLDYGDIVDFSLPCKHFSIRIPSRRANYIDDGIAYDKTGFPPDVFIPKQTTDWIGFVRTYWKQQDKRVSKK